MKTQKYIFCHSSYWVQDGILFCKLAKNIIVDEDLAKIMVYQRKLTFGNMEMPVCIDVENLLSVDCLARRYLASEEAWQYLNAGAFYTGNKLLEILGRAWFKLDPPPVPVNVFNSQAHALKWLQQYKVKS